MLLKKLFINKLANTYLKITHSYSCLMKNKKSLSIQKSTILVPKTQKSKEDSKASLLIKIVTMDLIEVVDSIKLWLEIILLIDTKLFQN